MSDCKCKIHKPVIGVTKRHFKFCICVDYRLHYSEENRASLIYDRRLEETCYCRSCMKDVWSPAVRIGALSKCLLTIYAKKMLDIQ